MRIKEYSIERYGPLANTGRIALGRFNLLFGNNEEGKSLSIDAIVKMLFNKKGDLKKFEQLERVEEMPQGYLVIEDENGKETKLPEGGDISKIAELSSSDCANLFVIRNSNLSISSESNFYRNVTDRLTGLRTEQISRLKEKLQDFGKLTKPESSASLSNDKKYGKIAGRVKDARALVEEIHEILAEVTGKGHDNFDEQLSQTDREIEDIDRKLGEMEYAEKRLRHEKSGAAMESFKKALQRIQELATFKKDDEQKWRDADRDLNADRGKKQDLLVEVGAKEKELRAEKEKAKKLRREFDSFQDKKRRMDDELKPDLKSHEKSRQLIKAITARDRYLKFPTYAASVLLGLFVLSLIFSPIPVLVILTILFVAIVITLWILRILAVVKESSVESDFERIRLNASRFGIIAIAAEDLLARIQSFEEAYGLKEKELNDITKEIEVCEKEIMKARQKELPDLEGVIESYVRTIDDLRRKSATESLEDFSKNLALKQKAERLRDEQATVLRTYFGGGQKTEENMKRWEKEIERLEEFKERAKGVVYDESIVAKLKSDKQQQDKRRADLLSSMETFKRQLIGIENSANRILQPDEERLPCSTCVDLDSIKKMLESFISKQEQNPKKIKRIIRILEEIEQEEEQKVQSLFGKNSLVSKYFGEITDGRYVEVGFVPEEGRIIIKLKDGKSQNASKLSGGSYDQLYLSIRLALGDRLLKGKKGFFIMDDPFIKADPSRLKKQMEILKKIADKGWQVLYFSAKGEVRDCLLSDIKSKDVKFTEIQYIQH